MTLDRSEPVAKNVWTKERRAAQAERMRRRLAEGRKQNGTADSDSEIAQMGAIATAITRLSPAGQRWVNAWLSARVSGTE